MTIRLNVAEKRLYARLLGGTARRDPSKLTASKRGNIEPIPVATTALPVTATTLATQSAPNTGRRTASEIACSECHHCCQGDTDECCRGDIPVNDMSAACRSRQQRRKGRTPDSPTDSAATRPPQPTHRTTRRTTARTKAPNLWSQPLNEDDRSHQRRRNEHELERRADRSTKRRT